MRARGGTLRVRASQDHMPGRDKPSRPAARIEFSDTGDGIPPEKLPHVFDPLFTVEQKGMGMGLSISSGLVELYDGQITVMSQVGIGTTFAILLPVGSQ
jgi:signal transduction histidine kinase